MRERRNHLPSDLNALRYLDALNEGDLETVAALWEEASLDPELERILTEVDESLFVEEAAGLAKAEAAQSPNRYHMRRPGGFRIPWPLAARRRWLGAAAAIVAAALLAVFALPRHDRTKPVPSAL